MILKKTLAVSQGIYFSITGIWPLIHMESFMAVTGPKTDIWLVKMVGLLAFVIGAVLLYAKAKNMISPPVKLLAAGSALAFLLIDFYYVANGTISPIYLADGFLEAIFVVLWIITWKRNAENFR